MKTILIGIARMGSSRFPGKVMKEEKRPPWAWQDDYNLPKWPGSAPDWIIALVFVPLPLWLYLLLWIIS